MQSEAPTLEQIENESAADTMRAVMSEMEGSDDAPDTEAEPREPDTSSDDRERDERGRFKAKDDGATEAPTDAEAPEGTEDAPEGEGAAGEAPESEEAASTDADEDDEPPHDWSAENQEMYRALPDKKTREFVKNSVEYAKQVYGQAEQVAQYYQNLEQQLAPRRDAWHRNGMDDAGAIRQLLALSDLANSRPQDFAQMYARERGLKPEDVFPELAQKANQDDEYADPEVSQLKKALYETRQEIEQFKNGYTTQQQQQQQAAQQQQYSQLMQYVDQFRSEADERGRPLRPYFQEVQGLMGSLLKSGSAPDLETAYDMACHATPGVRAKIVAAQNAQEQRERARKDREKADAARRAGTSISGTPGDRVRAEPSGDLREDLRSEFASRGML